MGEVARQGGVAFGVAQLVDAADVGAGDVGGHFVIDLLQAGINGGFERFGRGLGRGVCLVDVFDGVVRTHGVPAEGDLHGVFADGECGHDG